MLLRISLILAILAGLAIGTINFVFVKDKIVTIENQREKERTDKETAQKDARETHQALNKTTAELKQTQTELASTKDERDKAVAEATSEKKRADTVTVERDKARKERDDAQAELAAYRATDLKPEQIIAINKQYKELQKSFDGALEENALLNRKIVALTNELAIYKTPDYQVPLPPNLRGKVLVTDPKWNFVIISVGQDQGVLEHGELLVNRNGKLVAKVKVRSVQKDRSVANIMPGWQLGEVMEGDQVIPAHPASS
jgi:hypothetical protein